MEKSNDRMVDWKRRLYDGYVTTGQSGNIQAAMLNKRNPYFENIIKKHLDKNCNISIIDIGCGQGTLIYNLKKLGFTKVKGVDVSQEQINLAHKAGISEVICQDLHKFLSHQNKNLFDVVFLIDILEHIDKSEVLDFLDKINALMTEGAKVVIHVPNAAGIFGMKVRYGDFTHENAFTQKSIIQVLSSCNFEEIRCFEDKPIVHGIKSLIRYLLWELSIIPFRLIMLAETGAYRCILSQNMLVTAKKITQAK